MTTDFGEAEFSARENVSRETLERLRIYASLLREWNPSAKLVATSTLPELWTRHFLDSAQILRFGPHGELHWLDIGSGGGFPGMVLAIIAAERTPAARFTLVEAAWRKCQFLRKVAAETGIPVKLCESRFETLDRQCADAVTARAVAPLKALMEMAARHLAPGGICLFPKGAARRKDIDQAGGDWNFELREQVSVTNPEAAILLIRGLRRAR
ncbi:MAG: 16S rRNA (guanine(527)-N(7))-methyltransferase RsmG [Rhodobacteraceae bacterium]|nr:16S rRNA (guanine(527)-N(7))-methyltransferase RsmG [Paracoccaceae bacterium]